MDLAASKDRPDAGKAYALARPDRPPDVREGQCHRVPGTQNSRRISEKYEGNYNQFTTFIS